jgi:hypothetical protein
MEQVLADGLAEAVHDHHDNQQRHQEMEVALQKARARLVHGVGILIQYLRRT